MEDFKITKSKDELIKHYKLLGYSDKQIEQLLSKPKLKTIHRFIYS